MIRGIYFAFYFFVSFRRIIRRSLLCTWFLRRFLSYLSELSNFENELWDVFYCYLCVRKLCIIGGKSGNVCFVSFVVCGKRKLEDDIFLFYIVLLNACYYRLKVDVLLKRV